MKTDLQESLRVMGGLGVHKTNRYSLSSVQGVVRKRISTFYHVPYLVEAGGSTLQSYVYFEALSIARLSVAISSLLMVLHCDHILLLTKTALTPASETPHCP